MSISSISFGRPGHESVIEMGATLPQLPSYLERTFKIGETSINIPKGVSTDVESPVGKILSGLIAADPTTGPTKQQIDEAIEKIHTQTGGHPHFGTTFSEEIQQLLHPKPIETLIGTKEANETALEIWKSCGLINDEGTINFTKLCQPPLCDPALSEKQIRNAKLSGKIWVDDEGKFQMDVTFKFGEDAVKALSALKEKVNDTFQPSSDDSPISINPEDAGVLKGSALLALKHGGQIQFKSLPNGKTLKLILDPGEDGAGDGLTIEVWDKGNREKPIKSKKVPLSVVFEGQECYGRCVQKDDHPILGDWRSRELFQKSVVHTEKERIIPFTARFDRLVSDNTEDPARIQAQNTLWAAVWTYLEATIQLEEAKEEASIAAGKEEPKIVSAEEEPISKSDRKPTEEEEIVTEEVIIESPEDKKGSPTVSASKEQTLSLNVRQNLLKAARNVEGAIKDLLKSLEEIRPFSNEDLKQPHKTTMPQPQVAVSSPATPSLNQINSGAIGWLQQNPIPDEDNIAFDGLKGTLEQLQNELPDLFSNPLFLKQTKVHNPELFNQIQSDLTSLQQATASIMAGIANTTQSSDELQDLLTLAEGVNKAVNQLLGATPYEESDDLFNAAQDLVSGGLKDLVAGLEPGPASTSSPKSMS